MLYDIIIIGAGPAGLTAGIYAVRAGMKTLLLESMFAGGQAVNSNWVENYPGFKDGINGAQLCASMESQAKRLGVEFKFTSAKAVDLDGTPKRVRTKNDMFETKAIILATGAQVRRLGLAREDELTGAGISYCATCDGGFFKDKIVAVVGGGDTALTDAAYLSRLAKTVYIIHRRDAFRAAQASINTALSFNNVIPVWDSVIQSLEGEEKLSGLLLKNVKTDEQKLLEVDGAFIAVGTQPQTELFTELSLDHGFIRTDAKCKTALDGVYAAGDVRYGAMRQIVTAAADGATAAMAAAEYLASNKA